MYMLILLSAGLIELFMFESEIWAMRKLYIWVVLLFNLSAFFLGFLQGYSIVVLLVLIFVFAFRLINYLRIIKGRTNPERLKSSGLKTSFWLLLFTIAVVVVGEYYNFLNIKLLYLQSFQMAVAFGLLMVIIYNSAKISKQQKMTNYSDKDLPTLSVCIPARNETEQLEICINSLLASRYPKLEIIVLDDCSNDSTPDIVKKFAHDGVRFISGSKPDESWMPKNQAYQRLLDSSLGQIVVFCGVDTRFAPHTFNKLIGLMLSNNLDMISVLPQRLKNSGLSSIIQPMRYWWELALPRGLINSPPVLSTCWAINGHELKKIGGFKSAKNSVLPERHIAKSFMKNGKYMFIKSSDLIDVQTVKPVKDQRQTAVRVRYPQVHKRPELVMSILAMEVTALILPYILFISGVLNQNLTVTVLSLIAIVFNTVSHLIITYVSNPSNIPISMFNYPVVILTEIYLGLESMIRYEFYKVDWKDRNICLPVMQVSPKLPDF
jgi:glycosyltransferase involved in cell wall biosynthesis